MNLTVVRTVLLPAVAGALLFVAHDGAAQEGKGFRGRLPPYYSGIVTEGQRREIYKIQERYAAKIAELQSQLDALKQERDEEVEGVLTAAQLKRLATAREEGSGKRKKASDVEGSEK